MPVPTSSANAGHATSWNRRASARVVSIPPVRRATGTNAASATCPPTQIIAASTWRKRRMVDAWTGSTRPSSQSRDHREVERRHILLEGSLNLRDLGGYESRDGRRVRTGCVFRSDELHALTDADLETVAELGIRVLFDLRNAQERTARPNRLPHRIEVLERASPATGTDTRTTEEQIARGELPEADDEFFA